jgi:aminoglycoside phosphotransferase (APT) family kinase protein
LGDIGDSEVQNAHSMSATLRIVLLLAQGREAEVFLQDDGRVLKLFREAAWRDRAQNEMAALEVLRAAGVDAPRAYELIEVDGRPGVVMDRVQGEDMLTVVGKRPWWVWPAAASMARAHAAMHEVAAPPDAVPLNAYLRNRIDAGRGLFPDALADFALGVLRELPQGDRLCHGDFHLANILGDFSAPAIIDWGNATSGEPTGDVARTILLHRFAELPPGSSRFLHGLARVGRGMLVARYLRVYRRLHPLEPRQLDRWLIVRVAARFAEGIEGEYPALTAFLERARG